MNSATITAKKEKKAHVNYDMFKDPLNSLDEYNEHLKGMVESIKSLPDFEECKQLKKGREKKTMFRGLVNKLAYIVVQEGQQEHFKFEAADQTPRFDPDCVNVIYDRLCRAGGILNCDTEMHTTRNGSGWGGREGGNESTSEALSNGKKRKIYAIHDALRPPPTPPSPQAGTDNEISDGEKKPFKIKFYINNISDDDRREMGDHWKSVQGRGFFGRKLTDKVKDQPGYDGYIITEVKFEGDISAFQDIKKLREVRNTLALMLCVDPEDLFVAFNCILVALPLPLLPRLLEVLEDFELPGGKGLKATGEVEYRYIEVSVWYNNGELRSQLSRIAAAKKAPKGNELDVMALLANATIVDANGNVAVGEDVEVATDGMQKIVVNDEARQQKMLAEVPNEYMCSITLAVMMDPVMATDGHTYERGAIETWLGKSLKSPKDGTLLPNDLLIPNHGLKSLIGDWLDKNGVTLPPPPTAVSAPPAPAPVQLESKRAADDNMKKDGQKKLPEGARKPDAGEDAGKERKIGEVPSVQQLVRVPTEAKPPKSATLEEACREGDLEAAKELVESTDLTTVFRTCLHVAAENNYIEIVKVVLDHIKEVREIVKCEDAPGRPGSDQYYLTHVLVVVCEKGYVPLVELLVKHGAVPNGLPVLAFCPPPLTAAAFGGHLDVVEFLLHRCGHPIDVDQTSHCMAILGGSGNATTPFYAAMVSGQAAIARVLVEAGADFTRGSHEGDPWWNPLNIACQGGDTLFVKALLDKGADTTRKNQDGSTALETARKGGNEDVYRCIVDHADPKVDPKFLLAVEKGDHEAVKGLIEEGGGVNVNKGEMHTGNTPLWIAAGRGHLDMVQLLIAQGGDVAIASKDGSTPISIACKGNHTEIVTLLLDNGAAVNGAQGGRSCLHNASAREYVELVRLLLDRGADPSDVGAVKSHSLFTAVDRGNVEIVKLLVENGANVNGALSNGGTPLSQAKIMYGEGWGGPTRLEIIKYLKSKGATK